MRAGIRDVSLKRYLIDRRVPADLRPRLPLVAAGNLVLWVPGQPLPGAPLDTAAKAASGAGFTPAQRAGGRGGREVERSEASANPAYHGDAQRPRKTSGGGFIPTPRTTRRASVAPRILGRAPLAPPSSTRFVRLELHDAEAAAR